jgi:ATP-binding cassette subfamily B protein
MGAVYGHSIGRGWRGPPPPPVPPERRARALLRILSFFRPYSLRLAVVLFSIVGISLLGIVNPILIKFVIDDAIPSLDLGRLTFYFGLMIAVPIVAGLIGIGQTYLNNTIGQSIMRDLRIALYTHLQRMSFRFFTTTRIGDIQSRLGNDVGGIHGIVTNTMSSLAADVAVVVSTLVAMLLIDWRLTALSLPMLPLFLWLTYRVGSIRRRLSSETQGILADISVATEESLSVNGALLTKTFGRQEAAVSRFRDLNDRLLGVQVRQAMTRGWFLMIISTIFSVTPAFIYWLVGWLAIRGDPTAPTIGDLVAFTTLQSRLFQPLGQLLNVHVEIQGALALFDRIFEYLEMDLEIRNAPDALALSPAMVRGHVAFRNVSFSYPAETSRVEPLPQSELDPPAARPSLPGGAPPSDSKGTRWAFEEPDRRDQVLAPATFALQNISFEANPGELVALVGASGSGKTTTTYLIPRLYDVDAGAVEIDGHDVRSLTLESLGRLVGFVTQEAYLFHASVREILRFAEPDATDARLEAATRAAAIHDRILELPDGYDTIVGERGYKLSGGEKQRLAIARVLLKDPRILILDEATSSLDTVSERLIQSAIERLLEGRTTIAIAHRLSTILRADRILVYEQGRIVESGTHAELLLVGGRYARLYGEQFLPEAAVNAK